MLPFKLRSAPIIFSAIAGALQWIFINSGISRPLQYLELSKLEGPSTYLTFLRIEVDTMADTLTQR